MSEIATFAAGCFWCYQPLFANLRGVTDVAAGYTGGHIDNPTYEQVCTTDTGHAEAIQITFEPSEISYETLLDIFWHMHNPTTLNRQGNDVGAQYRSAIFYHADSQKQAAEASKQNAQADFDSPIVTEIVAAAKFYRAEQYHQDYYQNNPNQGYCQFVIRPKLTKLLEKYANLQK